MISYILMVVVLLILALMERDPSSSDLPGKLACAALILFGGLRHETGFDWVEYETYFELTRPVWSDAPQYIESSLLIEPGFALFTLVARSIGLSFQAFLFAIMAINMTTIYVFARRYTSRVALALLVYYGFVFLAAQMATIRQALSYSFLLLAFLEKEKGRTGSSLAMLMISVSIHTFSVIFIPLLYVRPTRIPISVVAFLVTIGIVTAFSGFHVVPIIADLINSFFGGSFLATKLSLYGDYEGYAISLVSLLFIPLHLLAYFLLTATRYQYAEQATSITHLAIAATLLSLITHSYFGVFPAFWNRVSYLSFLLQTIALTARYRAYFQNPIVPVMTSGLAGAAGTAIIAYTLSAPTSLPYVPYQNAAFAWITGDPGDGRWRYTYAFHQAEIEIASRRR